MTFKRTLQTVYIFDAESPLSQSLQLLLEAHNFIVRMIGPTDADLADIAFDKNDVVIFDLGRQQPAAYRLLNTLLFAIKRPAIIVTSAMKTALTPGDIFAGDRVELLFHPVAPKKFLDTMDALSL